MARKTPAPPSTARSLRARVRRYIVDHQLIRPGERLLAAVSGGPDSTSLLLTLASLRPSLKFDLHAAHFDHGLRGRRPAEREERFVRSLCARLDVPLHTGHGDVRAHARARSLEDAARELRYAFLARTARKASCDAVAAGHTRDDQAETVLLHLVRGAGLRGLAGMAPSSRWPFPTKSAPRLLRPLLALSRADTQAVCAAAGLAPMRDPTNRSTAYLRNRLRRELLPLLRRYNPRVDDALARLASAAAADVELLERLAAEALGAGLGAGDSVRLPRRRLAALPDSLQLHALRLAIARLPGAGRDVSERHLRALLRAATGPSGRQLDLPRGLRAEVARETIVLSVGQGAPATLPGRSVSLRAPGTAQLGPWHLEAKLLRSRPRRLIPQSNGYVYLDAGACGPRLSLRRRRQGDRFHPLGLAGPKKLQDFLVDAHVPRRERDALPLVCAPRGIAWVVGERLAEWAKVTPETRRVLRLSASRSGA